MMYNNLPENWIMRELKDFLDYEQPQKYIVSSTDYSEDYKTPVLTAGKSFVLGNTNETSGIYSDLPVIIFDDFTTASKYVDFPFKVKSSALKILKTNDSDLNLKYFSYFMQFNKFEPSTHKRYWISDYSKIKIAIPYFNGKPDYKEINYIVKTLDAVAEMIKLRKETIQLTQDLIPAIFQEMFGNFRGNEPIKKHVIVNPPKALLNDNEEVSFLSMADVSVDGYILSSKRRRYSDVRNGFSSFMNDDVILAKITPCYENGKGAIVRDLINGIGFGSTEFYVLRCDKQYILPEYLFYLLRSDDFMALGKCHMKGAAGQKRLDKLFLQNFGITYPSLSQQEEFAKKVEQINQNLEVQQKDLERLQELFDQLLQKAFTGELTRGEAYGII